ncbi:MAG TPA: condensation domain-containing protein, partial [Thermoanaerobaculia bacterium]|nr:condensation domain-containing protein [Thermoanaerobaculia bacterium]
MPEGDLAARRGRLTDAQRALLERRLKGSTGSAAAEETEAIPRREGSGPAPLSLAQERVWWFARRHPESRVGNVYHAIGLTGPLAREALRSALAALVARHEVLRTRFPEVDGAPVAIASGPPPRLPMVDLAALPPAPRTEEGLRAIAELAAPPFDLERGPVLRTALLARGARENALALAVHHIAIDGWSLALLANEIAALYEAFVSGRPPALPEPPLQAADFASWQRRQIATGKLEDELSWWCERLSGAEIARPPLWPRRQGAAGGRVALNLDAGRAEALRAFARAERATPFQMILAAYQAVLGRRFGIDDVIVGTPFSLRGRPEVARLVGFLLNLLTLRTDLSGNPTFRQALDRTRETALGAFARREVPFELLA